MIHPIPSGTRDVLPDEMREMRAITEALRGVFEAHDYGEVYTPALEYEAVLARAEGAGAGAGGAPVYRLFDEAGALLVLRSDMTVPIARVAATRYAHVEPPCASATSPTATAGFAPSGASPASCCRPASS